MIKIRVEAGSIAQKLRQAPSALRENVKARVKPIVRSLYNQAKRTAPQKSGELKSRIYSRVYEKNLAADVGIYTTLGPSGYDYTKFVTGKEVINVGQTNQYFAGGQKIRYGTPARTRSNKSVRWTANSYWWFNVEKRAKREYPIAVRKAVKGFVDKF